MHVLVTGISGFVGQRLARNLLEHGHRVSGTFQASAPAPRLDGVDLYQADLLDPGSLEMSVHASQPDAIVHLAGFSSVGESWKRPGECFRLNVLGTENVLAAAATGGKERKVVYASSAEVYGIVPEEEQPLSEERQLDPLSPYALTKAAAERIALPHGAVVARAFNMIGPGQAPRFAFPSFAGQLAAIARRETPAVIETGNRTPRRDFVHIEDGADAFRILAERGRPGRAYNIAGGKAVSIGEALERLCAIAGIQAELQEKETRKRDDDPPLFVGDSGRLRKLGWEPRRGLDQALSDLWEEVRGC
jgi:GDP-4-dehydro-6-deoxy-D-mannose reductase